MGVGEASTTGSQALMGLAARTGAGHRSGLRPSLLSALRACFLLSPPALSQTKLVSAVAEAVCYAKWCSITSTWWILNTAARHANLKCNCHQIDTKFHA